MNPGDRDAGLKVREMRKESRTKTAGAEMTRKVAQRRTSLTGASGACTPPSRPAWITASPTPSLPTRAELSSFWPRSLFPCQGAQLGAHKDHAEDGDLGPWERHLPSGRLLPCLLEQQRWGHSSPPTGASALSSPRPAAVALITPLFVDFSSFPVSLTVISKITS